MTWGHVAAGAAGVVVGGLAGALFSGVLFGVAGYQAGAAMRAVDLFKGMDDHDIEEMLKAFEAETGIRLERAA